MQYVGPLALHLRTVSGRETLKIVRPRCGNPRVAQEMIAKRKFQNNNTGRCTSTLMVLPETRTLHLYTGIWDAVILLNFIIITTKTTQTWVRRCLFFVNCSRYQTLSPPTGMHAETHRGQNTV